MMQRYKSHKIVEAGKIQRIHTVLVPAGKGTQAHVIDFVEVGGQQYDVPEGFAAREKHPQIGDYLVRYEDGYLSWSPAAAFEAGYNLLEEGKHSIDQIEDAINRSKHVELQTDGTVLMEKDDDVQQDGSADKDGVQS